MEGITCFICSGSVKEDEERCTIKEKALATFIQASKRRKDGHHTWLESQTAVIVHDKCRKGVYTKESYILKAEREANNPPARATRANVEAFQFQRDCLYCSKDASETFKAKENKKEKKKRDFVHEVMNLETIQSIKATASDRGDTWGENVLRRLSTASDLPAAEARYHHSCNRDFFLSKPTCSSTPANTRGRPENVEVTECLNFICNYMEENEDLCQYTLEDILQSYSGHIPRKDFLLKKLSERCKDDIIVVPGSNQYMQSTICFRKTGHSILSDNWYESRKSDGNEERMRIVKAAAQIIREDIRSKMYPLDKYPSPDIFLDSVNDDVPDSLHLLLNIITSPIKKTKTTDGEQKQGSLKKIQAIAHSLISAARPRSFTSPILLGVGTLLYRKYGSRHLVDVLSALGFCCSYSEVRKFEVSTLQQPLDVFTLNAFTQFVFDNADINMDTLDGKETFHAMGGIQIFTPKKSLIPRTPIAKVKSIPKASSLKQYGSMRLEVYDKPSESGFSTITIEATTEGVGGEVLPRLADLLWMYGKWKDVSNLPGWNGFMEVVTSNQPFQTSRILCLPFIRASPSDNDTIYTALKAAAQKCVEQRQKTCFVTFDQPLYIKARAIVASSGPGSELSSIIVRLGGFHLLMSFMGAIGFIMDGSGLQDLLSVSFALASTKTMMSGHHYSRAVRGHILAQLALGKHILSTMDLTDQENAALLSIINNFESGGIDMNDPNVENLLQKFKLHLKKIENNGPTAKLWIQYFRMVSILKQFIEAERSGDWELHLESIKNMLPYFHASGHFNYAKASQLYLQDMLAIHTKLTPAEYEQFVAEGFFTIRRSEKHWSGIWSDMTIEQVLMRAISSCGGLSQGRGISDGTLARWIAGMPTAVDVSHQIEEFCGVSFKTSDQHVDTTDSRMNRDNIDVQKFCNWFDSHDPFPLGESIMCISTGVVGGDDINCYKAYEMGKISMDRAVGKNFKELKFQRKHRVMPLRAVNCTVKVNGEPVPVDPDTIFRRIPFHAKSPQQLESYFGFELAPYPLSLFDDGGMRKTRKSDLYKLFNPVSTVITTNATFVVDGGFLLHRVVWDTNELFSSIIEKYVNYVKKHFGSNCAVVFDGYPADGIEKSIKSAERTRRARAMSSASVLFEESMVSTMPKERFLSNEQNKKRLILMLTEKLRAEGFQVQQATEDADYLIVKTAIDLSTQGSNVFIVGEDVDLLVLLTAHVVESNEQPEPIRNIFLMKPGKGRQDTCFYSPNNCKLTEEAKKNLLFLHAFSGCDSTSAFFRQGKTKFVNTFQKYTSLQKTVSVFMDPDATPDQVAEADLCYVDTIAWDQVILQGERDLLFPGTNRQGCPPCNCPNGRCWSEKICQKHLEDYRTCHPECVGGCTGDGPSDCVSCRNFELNGTCIHSCPAHMYEYKSIYCKTKDECLDHNLTNYRAPKQEKYEKKPPKDFFPWESSCVSECPNGFEKYKTEPRCRPCKGGRCKKVCDSGSVDSLQGALHFKDCTYVNGSLEISIKTGKQSVVAKELEHYLGNIVEIQGYLKVFRSFPLVSLGFLKNLRVIHGTYDGNHTFNQSFIVHDNQNLQELWNWDTRPAGKNFKILNGRPFFHYNPMLCFKHIKEMTDIAGLTNLTPLEVAKDSNGGVLSCNLIELNVSVHKRYKDEIVLVIERPQVPKGENHYQMMSRFVAYYIEDTYANVTETYETNPCPDNKWYINDIKNISEPFDEGTTNGSVYHTLSNLKPYTLYAYYIKTYTGGQSPIQYVRTLPSQPSRPTSVEIFSNSSSEIVIRWAPPEHPNGEINEYFIKGFIQPDDHAFLKTVDYCKHPVRKPTQTTPPPKFITHVEEKKKCDCDSTDGTNQKGEVKERVICEAQDPSLPPIPLVNFDSCQKYMYSVIEKTFTPDIDDNHYEIETHLIHRRAEDSSLLKEDNDVVLNEEIGPDKALLSFSRNFSSDLNLTTISSLRHFSTYTFEVIACRKRVEEDQRGTKRCSHAAYVTSRTMPDPEADDIVGGLNVEVVDRMVMLSWKPPISNGMTVSYQIELVKTDRDETNPTMECILAQTAPSGQYTLKDLELGKYRISIRSLSLAGPGQFTPPEYFTISEYSIKEVIIIVILVFIVLIVIGTAFIVYYRKKLLRPVLIASVNPDYCGLPLIDDEWELPRERIRLGKELKRGNFGVVCEGILSPEGTVVAVKKSIDEEGTPRNVADFLNEAMVMKQFVGGAHIVKLLGVVSKDAPQLVVMEMMANGDLKSYLRECRDGIPPSPQRMILMAAEIADGMAYLEASKFIHRDLAARNCMVSDKGVVKIGDFGMTRDVYETDYYRKGNKGLLPIRWMAPESLNDGVFSSKSDAWSYGIVLWEMATLASQPYQGMSNEQVLNYVISGNKLQLPPVYPKPFKTLTNWCWKWKPKFRPAFIEILTELEEHLTISFRAVSFFNSPAGIEAREALARESPSLELRGDSASFSFASYHISD